MNKNVREPLFHLVKRDSMIWWKSWIVRLLAVVLSLLVSGILIFALTGENPVNVYITMFQAGFATRRRFWALLQNVAMLLCVALAVTPAFKMRFWNIGAEGQALMGGLATAACMVYFGSSLPSGLLLLVIFLSSMLAGAVWALIPAVFKAAYGTNETLFTLMMNYVAAQIVSYFTYVHSNPKGSGQMGVINKATQAGWLPKIEGNNYLLNILIVLIITILVYIYLSRTKHGYEISVVGQSENTARYIGIDVGKVIIRTLLISGALCGICGFLLVSGTDHTLTRDTIAGRGFTAIIVSWMAKFNPLYMIVVSFLICFLQKGAVDIASTFGFNDALADIITGIIIFFIIGSEFFIGYKIKFNHHRKGGHRA